MAMSESRRRKLEMLTRSIARGDFASARRLLREHGHAGVNHPDHAADRPVDLSDACAGHVRTLDTPAGPLPYYHVARTLAEIAPAEAGVARDYAAVMRGARRRFDEDDALAASAGLCHAADATPEEPLFMDIETCGFCGTAVFLVGLMRYADGDLHFEQHLARNYAEEPAILQAFADRYADTRLLVTFNGKRFDMGMIRERSAVHGIELPRRRTPHLDLLDESRRRWRRELPNCRLQTLERYICRRRRVGDIPGAEIPEAYHRFVASGDARQIADILHHNLLDLLTMAQVLAAILTGWAPPES